MHDLLDEDQVRALTRRTPAERAAVLLAIDHPGALPLAQSVDLHDEARGWLADCGWGTAARDGVDDALVRALVHRAYDGGWPGFVVSNADLLGSTGGRT